MDGNLLDRLARFALLALAAAVVATSYIVTEPPEDGLSTLAIDAADTRPNDPPL